MVFRALDFTEVEYCPLCGQDRFKQYDQVVDTLITELNRFLPATQPRLSEIINQRQKCLACGLVFLAPRLTAESLALIYQLWYQYAFQQIFADVTYIQERRKEFVTYHLAMLQQVALTQGKLLDVGCGSGIFLDEAKKRGWTTYGIELNAEAATAGNKNYAVNIHSGTITSVLTPADRFDAITLFDYLEHSMQPGQDLATLVSHLNSNGVMLLRVPNLNGLQAQLMQNKWLAVIANHLSYFSAPVLVNALQQLGLTVEKIQAGNYQSEFDILRRRWSWLKNKINHKPMQSECGGNSPVDAYTAKAKLKRFFYSLFIEQVDQVGGWINRGNNLMVIARKKN